MNLEPVVIVGILGLLGALAASVIQIRSLRAAAEKSDADAADVLTRVAMGFVEPLQARADSLQLRLDQCEAKAVELSRLLDEALDRERRLIAAFDVDPSRLPAMPLPETPAQRNARRWKSYQPQQVYIMAGGLAVILVLIVLLIV